MTARARPLWREEQVVRIRFVKLSCTPDDGCVQPGEVVDRPTAEARALIDAGAAVAVEAEGRDEAPEPETARKTTRRKPKADE